MPAGQWTFGTSLATRAVHALLVASIVAGPLALVVSVMTSLAPAQQARPTRAIEPAAAVVEDQTRAAAAAQQLLLTWLTASRADLPRLNAQLLDPSVTAGLRLPTQRPPAPTRVWTESSEQMGETRWNITIGAQGPGGGWFTIPVQVTDGLAAAVALPARTGQPALPTRPDPQLWTTVTATDPLAVTVRGYLAGLLTDAADLDRWTSPGSTMTTISPAPCSRVDMQSVVTDTDQLPKPTAEASGVVVLATAVCVTAKGPAGVSQYPLLLTARAGRWEVSQTLSVITNQATAGSEATTPTTPSPGSTAAGGPESAGSGSSDGEIPPDTSAPTSTPR